MIRQTPPHVIPYVEAYEGAVRPLRLHLPDDLVSVTVFGKRRTRVEVGIDGRNYWIATGLSVFEIPAERSCYVTVTPVSDAPVLAHALIPPGPGAVSLSLVSSDNGLDLMG